MNLTVKTAATILLLLNSGSRRSSRRRKIPFLTSFFTTATSRSAVVAAYSAAKTNSVGGGNHNPSSNMQEQQQRHRRPGRRRIIHLNHAGDSPSSSAVVERIVAHLRAECEVGGYTAAAHAKDELARVYQEAATLINGGADEIALVESATVAWTRIFYAFVHHQHLYYRPSPLSPLPLSSLEEDGQSSIPTDKMERRTMTSKRPRPLKKVILMSEAEYAANVVAACQWVRTMQQQQGGDEDGQKDWVALAIPSSLSSVSREQQCAENHNNNHNNEEGRSSRSNGKVDLDVFRQMLEGKYYYYCNDDDEEDDDAAVGGSSATTSSESATHRGRRTRRRLDPRSIVLVCVTHIGTGSGIVNPIEEIGTMIHDYNTQQRLAEESQPPVIREQQQQQQQRQQRILYLVDTCQSIGQRVVDVQQIRCDAAVATGRKYLRGPRGTGFLYVNHDLLAPIKDEQQRQGRPTLWPHHVDHYGVPVTSVPNTVYRAEDGQKTRSTAVEELLRSPIDRILDYQPLPTARRFEFWESNIASKVGLGVALRHVNEELDMAAITTEIQALALDLYQRLRRMDSVTCGGHHVRLHHRPECGIVTFWIDEWDAAGLAQQLLSTIDDDSSVDVRGADNDVAAESAAFELSVVPATSTPLDSARTGIPKTILRASLSYTNTIDEIDLFCQKLQFILSRDQCS